MKMNKKKGLVPQQKKGAAGVFMFLFNVVVNLSNKSLPEIIVLCRRIVSQMTGNLSFPTPNPSLATFSSAIDTLEAKEAIVSRGGSEADLIARDEALAKVLSYANLEAAYVENASLGDRIKILSAGYEVRGSGQPIEMVQVTDLKLARTEMNGEMLARWKRVRGVKTYRVQFSTDINDESKWADKVFCTKATTLIKDLEAGTYWVRVAAIGSSGQGPFSDPGRLLVL